MKNDVITGNSFLDKMRAVIPNPEYNPKTKKGRSQPTHIIDTSASNIGEDFMSNTIDDTNRLTFTGRELGYTNEDIERDANLGISLSPYNTEDELNKARSEAQGNIAKFGNFLMQAGVGEVILGTMEGFGNIADGIINTFTGDNYGVNPYTQFMTEAKENFKKNYQIYRRDPNASWDMGDFGWWMDNAVSIASTASLLLPAAGWARALSMVGKTTGASKALSNLSRWASRGLAGAGKASKVSNKFGALKAVAGKANRIERTINEGAEVVSTALLSRTGEGYMEAKAVYDDVYNNSKENLDNMPDEEFAKFINRNPQFIDMSKDDIAKEIARKSANTTFYNDYAMLLMDIPQFKALGKLWGRTGRRATTVSERIAAENARRVLAGKSAENLIKDNIWNRSKEGIRYALKNPKNSFFALELGEGFEEMYQGIQTEKGMEVAQKYFDPTMTSRSLSSYLSDGSIWEQGFWGSLGGVAFNKVGRGIQNASKAIQGAWNKKHMTADEYERWKRSNTKISIEQLNNITTDVDEFLTNMQTISEGKNPFNFVVDPETGQEIIKNGELVNEEIDETQANLLKEKAISKFVDNVTMTSVDNGTFNLMKEVLGSTELDQYIANNGLQLDANDKALSQQIIDRMDEVADIYENSLKDVNALADTTNPFITIAAARSITRNKLKMQEYDDTIANINQRIAEKNDTNTDYSAYTEREKYETYKRHVDNLIRQKKRLSLERANNEISESAYQAQVKEINKTINTWNAWAEANTEKGALEAVRKEFNEALGKEDTELTKSFNNFIAEYEKATRKARTSPFPPETIRDLIDAEIDTEVKRNYTSSQIPTSQQEYEDLYNEFGRSMDAMELARRDEYLERVKNYLASVDNLDEALNKIYSENTGNAKVDEALHYLRYLSDESTDIQLGGKGQFTTNMSMDDIINTERQKRENATKANEEAEKEGVGTPPAPEQEATSSNNPSSTGGVQGTTSAEPAASAAPAPVAPTQAAQSAQPQPQAQPQQAAPQPQAPTAQADVDLGGGDEHLKNPMDVDTSADPLDESYDTPSLRAEIKARQYIMQVGFKSETRLNEITETLSKGDNSKRDAFLNEVVNYLVKQGFDINIARKATGTAFTSTVNLFGAMNTKSAFGKLAQQLALGFSKKAAEKHAVTEFMTDKELKEALNDTVDEFLTEYSKIVNNEAVGDGKFVINIESLFDYLLNNEDIDAHTAMYIYNNLSQYIATHNGSKYIFTGFNTVNKLMLSAVEFMNQLKENKAQLRDTVNKLHISPIELRQRQGKRETQEYREALEAAHNGTATRIYVEPQYTTIKVKQPNGYEEHKKVMSNLNVVVEYKKDNKVKNVKIGILRTVRLNEYGDKISPIRHQSGFANIIDNSADEIQLDCDFLFEAIIERKDADAKQLWKDIADYYLLTRDIIDRRKRGEISLEKANKELSAAMNKDMAERIMKNPYIVQALATEVYKFDVGVKYNDIARARDISSKIAGILFFGREDDVSDPTNFNHNSFATDKETLNERYEIWKEEVNTNYEQTYKMQEAIEAGDEHPVIRRLNVSYTTQLNILPEGRPMTNIGELNLDFSKTINGKPNSNYTPFVYVKNGRLLGEDGVDYGEADPNIGDYSMGYIVYKDKNMTQVAYFKKTNEISNSPIATKLKDELRRLILAQLNNTFDAIDPARHEVNFERIKTLLTELCGYQGLFRLGNHFGEGDITVRVTNDGQTINILHYDRFTKKTKPIMAFFSYDSKGNPGHAIRVFGQNYDSTTNNKDYIDINSINGNQNISGDTVKQWLNFALDDMFKSVKLNRSALGFNKKTAAGGTPTAFSWDDNTGKFTLTLNGEKLVYNNYADFVTQNNGFQVNVYQNEDGSFVTRYMNENRITADTAIQRDADVPQAENHAVSDMLYTNEANPKRKTADTSAILEAAGVEQDKIDILLGTNSGLPIVTKRITVSPERNDDFMYYNLVDKRIHITPKGAMAMNGNPKNAVRLILHENLHRHFNSTKYTNAERQRITDELQTVYDYVRNKIEEDHTARKINDNLYNQFVSVLDKSQVSKDQQTRMEEFLVECLTQAPLTEWLNNTEYGADADIIGINQKKKSILQKIMDILLDLLGIKTQNIKNNSILAREYVILSKGVALTTAAGTTGTADTNRGTQPVEGSSQTTSGVGRDTVGGSPVALEYLLTGGKGTIESTGYFLHGVAAAFPELTNQIEDIRSKYLTEINPVPLEYANSDHRSIGEIRNLISKRYGSKGVNIFNTLLANANGFYERDGRKVSQDIDNLQPITPTNNNVLDRTKAKIDTIRTDFETRIKRSPNFAEDHTYLLDGEPIDYSVTQKIHGKQDIGKYGTPASTLGNTADAAARGYFDNNGVVTDDMHIPNVRERQREDLIADMSKIEAHLDEKFGKGRYRVITQEFPIGGTITVNGEVKTIAGTMDMLVYTDTGDIYVYDFKTKRVGNSDGNIAEETLRGYKQQVNIYRQILEENYPELKGKVHTGSLIKFNVDYPEPTNTTKYRVSPNDSSQLQISRDGGKTYENIQDALVDYMSPSLADDYNNPKVIIPVEEQDYGDAIGALPEPKVQGLDINNAVQQAPKVTSPEDVGLDSEGYIVDDNDEDYDYDFNDAVREAVTEEITDNANSSVEIYAPAIADGAIDNAYGVQIVNSMDDFIGQFPIQYQADIKLILDSNEINYTCR